MHLISSHRLPLSGQLGLDGAYRYLLDAPQMVKQLSPMSWTYVSTPQDGTMWLEWLSPDRNNDRFPSDGYVWADPEQTFRQNVGGFEMEVMVHAVGYRAGYDSVATHARTRYHFVNENPNHNAPPPDPQLWIVHYHPTDPQRHVPTQQIAPNPQTQQILRERAWLENQGRIEKKDFMLHDRENWPTINVPNLRQHPMAPQNAWPPPQAQYPRYPNAYPQPPPAKRQRQQAPAAMPGSGENTHDTSVEDEENTTLGDYFDHLTPRDISMARYLQHHRWMEEVFSSPYASHQIVPVDLGLGLMGELKGLTTGILEPPSMDFLERPEKPVKAKEAQPFTNLKQDQLEEFNSRVNKHLEDGQAEIERMKVEHAAKIQEWRKTKTLMQAEKRLRHATWEGHETDVSALRLEVPIADGHAEEVEEKIEDVVKEVESLLGIKIASHEEADIIEKGGLEDEDERHRDQMMQDSGGSASQATMFHQDPMSAVQNQTQEQEQAQSSLHQQTIGQTGPPASVGPEAPADVLLPDDIINEDSMMDDINLDLNDTGVDFDEDDTHTSMTALAQPQPAAAETVSHPPSQPHPATGINSTQHQPDLSGQADMMGHHSAADPDIFGDTTFDDLTNMGGDEGGVDDDGLIDFDGGVGMEDSAFGDALHGMEGGDESVGGEQHAGNAAS